MWDFERSRAMLVEKWESLKWIWEGHRNNKEGIYIYRGGEWWRCGSLFRDIYRSSLQVRCIYWESCEVIVNRLQ